MNFIKSFLLPDHSEFELTESEIILLNESLKQIMEQSEIIADDFYKNLFKLDPSLQALFHHDRAIQEKKFMNKLIDIVQSSQQKDQMRPILKDLGKNHLLYGIKAEHYSLVGAALLTTLKIHLNEVWNNKLNDAWVSLFTNMVMVMKTTNVKAA